MKMPLNQKILTGFIACTVILVIVAVISFRNTEKFTNTNQSVNHTHEVLDELNQLLTTTVDAETGVRGFVITGNEVFLDPYNKSRQNIGEHLDKVKKLIADNPSQQKNIETLQNQLNIHSKYHENLITIRKSDFEKAKQIVSTEEGKRIQDEIRRIIANSKEIKNTLLAQRKKSSEDIILPVIDEVNKTSLYSSDPKIKNILEVHMFLLNGKESFGELRVNLKEAFFLKVYHTKLYRMRCKMFLLDNS